MTNYAKSHHRWQPYATAVVAVLAAAIVRSLCAPLLGASGPYQFFILAVVVAALHGGLWPGLLCTLLGTFTAHWLFVQPFPSSWTPGHNRVFHFLSVIATGAGISALGHLRLKALITSRRAAGDLDRTAKILKAISESTHDLMFAKDTSSRLVWVNPGTLRSLGRTEADLLGMNEAEWHTHPDESGTILENDRRVMESGETLVIEETFTLGEDPRIFLVTKTALRDEEGKVIGLVGLGRDITDRKNIETSLRQSEERYKSFVKASAQIVWVMDAQGRGTAEMSAWQEYTGQTQEETTGFRWIEAVHPDDRARVRDAWRSAVESRSLYEVHYRLKRHDGEWRQILARGVPIFEVDGNVREWIGTCIDVTEHKEAEAALHRSQQQVRLILEAAPVGICYVGADYRYKFANNLYCRRVGTHPDAMLGKTVADVLGEATWSLIAPRMKEALQGVSLSYDLPMKLGDEQRVFQVAYEPDLDETGVPRGLVVVSEDVTERKRNEEALAAAKLSAETAKAAAEEASRAKDNFLAVLSHELRTPLTPVLAAVQLLQKRSDLDTDVRENLDLLYRNVQLEARLIDDLLDLTRIVRGKITLDQDLIDVREVIERVVAICSPDISEKRLEFKVDLPETALTVRGDMARLQQIFWNLLKNSIKFTPSGGSVSVRASGCDGIVRAEVEDNGVGIEEESLGRIFTAFEQENRHTTRQFGGLGLGLAITKRLVEGHGGDITAHSCGRGNGATFRISLPRAEISTPMADGLEKEQSPKPLRSGIRLLLVEDHEDTAAMMRKLLVRTGYEVEVAHDAEHGLAAASSGTFDILLSDLGLPDRSGLDLMKDLRALGTGLKGIALSGYGREEDVSRSKEAGFSAHLTEPVDYRTLLSTLSSLL